MDFTITTYHYSHGTRQTSMVEMSEEAFRRMIEDNRHDDEAYEAMMVALGGGIGCCGGGAAPEFEFRRSDRF